MVKARAEIAAGMHTPESDSITVREAADLWLERCARDNLEETTLRSYREHVRIHIVPFLGDLKLSKLTTPEANSFVDRLLCAGRSRNMTNRVLRSLTSIVAEAKGRGLVSANHVRDAKRVKLSKRGHGRLVMPSKQELRSIIDATPARHRPLILTAVFTGLRASELRGITWEDIDLKDALLHVRRRVDRFNRFGLPKSEAATREIPLPPIVVNTLREWKLLCPRGQLDLVFPTGNGTVESHSNILSRIFWPIQIAAGVTVLRDDFDDGGRPIKKPDAKYSLHALRHAAAALFIEQGLSPKRIQGLIGHASIQQTFDQYGYLFESRQDDRTAMAAIEERLLG